MKGLVNYERLLRAFVRSWNNIVHVRHFNSVKWRNVFKYLICYCFRSFSKQIQLVLSKLIPHVLNRATRTPRLTPLDRRGTPTPMMCHTHALYHTKVSEDLFY